MTSIRASLASSHITPKNANQKRYLELLKREKPYVVIASGSSGTGKTTLATYAGVQKLENGDISKIVITRPTVCVGTDDIGFLPGTLEDKMQPWVRPIYDALQLYYPYNKIERMVRDDVIEIAPLGFLRGRTFVNSWIICDESQNMTTSQMLMMLTRIGQKSKLVITGDPDQYDRGFDENGLSDLIRKLENRIDDNFVDLVKFDQKDVERHPAIPYFLNIYSS